MMLLLLLNTVITELICVSATSNNNNATNQEIVDLPQDFWPELGLPSLDERRSRAISSFNQGNSHTDQCPGTVITMLPGYATVIKSHNGYGKEPYPSDYEVRRSMTTY